MQTNIHFFALLFFTQLAYPSDKYKEIDDTELALIRTTPLEQGLDQLVLEENVTSARVLIIVLDTSGSMRGRDTNSVRPTAVRILGAVPAAFPVLQEIRVYDGAGYLLFMYRNGQVWNEDRVTQIAELMAPVAVYNHESVSNTLGGLSSAFDYIQQEAAERSYSIFVVGDEWTATSEETVHLLNRARKLSESHALSVSCIHIRIAPTAKSNFLGLSLRRHLHVMRDLTTQTGGQLFEIPYDTAKAIDEVDERKKRRPR